MKKAKSVLIVGGGRMGLSHGLICSALLGKANVTYVEKSMLARFALTGLGFPRFDRVKKAFKEESFTHAIVTTPTGAHLPVIEEILELGVSSLFIEKPLSSSAIQSEEILKLAQERACVGQVGYVYRFNPNVLHLRSILLSERYGEVESYELTLSGNVIKETDGVNNNWRCNDKSGGGVLRDFGSHLIDLSRFLFGDVTDITNPIRIRKLSVDVEDQCSFNLLHSNTTGSIGVDWCDTRRRKATLNLFIRCAQAELELRGNELYVKAKDQPETTLLSSSLGASVGFYLRGEEFSLQLDEFLGLQDSYTSRLSATIKDGVLVDQLIEQVREAPLAS